MAISWDGSGLVILEQQLAALVAEQTTSPGSFGADQAVSTVYKQGAPGGPASAATLSSITVEQIVQRLQACVALAQTLLRR
jgi:hypothetical protein